ncbi:UvrD-helicase domain-containing protein [Pleurocapsa sp. CCALA 161]|uniref:UvrD-helicase domain-containing protein n=1 Tax=Pleurocapsa sp. CCALA 161 TaxID=2107688 RepID=UPI002101D13B|nr:UvrD-helicase domain-containing protein [Pleurocapsa sp. CCALA 161]
MKWLQADSDARDAVVNSVAGSGKSTLLKLAADAISTSNVKIQDCLVLVFNKKNKTALVKKLDSRWQYSISTVHSAGYQVLKKYLGVKRLEVEESKYRHLAKTLDWFDGSDPQQDKVVSLSSFLKLFEFVRLTLSPLTTEALSRLVEHYALDINKQHLNEISQRIDYLFKVGMDAAANEARIDHTDMLWLPVVWQVNQMPGFKFAQRVMVDEAQDMSCLQLEFVLSLAHEKAKMLFVGDPAQSINGFCGADTDSFSNIQVKLQAKEFTLPVCYRCPKIHIELINKLYPEIPIVPRDNAPLGSIKVIQEWDLWDETKDSRIKPGDLVIARCSSSLVDLHLKMIVRGIPCNLVGSSLQQELLNLLAVLAEQPEFEYQKFAEFSQSYLKFKQSIYEQNDNGAILLLQLKDQIKAVGAIYNHFQTKSLAELASSIRQLFGSEDAEAVLLSTVHRAKGMESERVYIAEPLTLPLLWEGQKEWQEQQEQNLLYVALSRSTKDLFLIGDAFWYDQKTGSIIDKHESDLTSVEGSSVTELVKLASSEELEQYIKTIRSEQGKRISQRFQSLV